MDAEKRHLFQERNRIKSQFSRHFEGKGLAIVEPAPLISREDTSVRFTGATINRFKPMLGKERLIYPGYATIQPCLRLFSLNSLLDKDAQFHICYFTMLGTIFHVEVEKPAVAWCVAFLQRVCGIPASRLKVKVASRDQAMLKALIPLVNVDSDGEATDFYNWKFGMDGISGRGATFSVWNESRQKWGDIGNFIEIWSSDGMVASEFSIGLEMMQYHLRSLPDFLSATTVEGIMPEFPGKAFWKLKDALSTLVAMYHGGILAAGEEIPPQTKHGALVRKALKNMVFLQQAHGVSGEKLEAWIDAFSEAEFGHASAHLIRPGLAWAAAAISENTSRFKVLLRSLAQREEAGKLTITSAREAALKKADGAYSLPAPLRDQLLREAGLLQVD